MGIDKYEVSADKLEWHCAPAQFAFDCTKDLALLREFVGQDRAIRAIEFGLSMDRPEGSINYEVDKKLKDMADKLRQFASPPAEEKKSSGS